MSVRHLALLLAATVLLPACGGRHATAPVVESAPTCAPCPQCVQCLPPETVTTPSPAPAATPPVTTTLPPVTTPGPPAPPTTIAAKPLLEAQWRDLPGWGSDDLAPALAALIESCAVLKQAPWPQICADAAKLNGAPRETLQRFFETRFAPHLAINADGTRDGLITGYYEPLVKGARQRSKAYAWPIYAPPDDLLAIDLGDTYPELKALRLRGRYDGRKIVPYWTREELSRNGRLAAKDALFWLADPVDLFFLQVQGSGRIELDDGTRVRVGYADSNGHPYKSIGRWLIEHGELKLEQASQDGIKVWARANPTRLDEMLNANPSYIFFRELSSKGAREVGPPGALGVPLTAGRSLAVDTRVVPLGAPVWLATTHPGSGKPLQRLMTAQDTGSAIKGGVRADFYWGFGAEAGALAGRMRQGGRMWVLLPR